MKIFKKTLIALTFILILYPARSEAVSLGVGVSTWYNWWDGYFAGLTTDVTETKKQEFADMESGFLYGPLLSLRFNETFSISTLFMIGNYSATHSDTINVPLIGIYPAQLSQEILRYDNDTALNFDITSYFKIFIGFKLLHLNIKSTSLRPGYTVPIFISKIRLTNYAPAVGFGFSIPVTNDLYLLWNLSILFSIGDYYQEASYPWYIEHDKTINQFGANSRISFAYSFSSINTVLMIGFRYQLLYVFTTGDVRSLSNSKFDSVYGIEALAMYRMDFSD